MPTLQRNGTSELPPCDTFIYSQSDRNYKETLAQNYRRLGLSAKLNQVSGGTGKAKSSLPFDSSRDNDSSLNIKTTLPSTLQPREARVERDPATGRILRIIEDDEVRIPNPLNDPINDVENEDEYEDTHTTPLVEQLQRQAARGERKTKRKPSVREMEWVQALVAKHGENYSKMVWDRELNPMQQSEGDIKRRIQRWRENHG
jgi:nucleolar protein 16